MLHHALKSLHSPRQLSVQDLVNRPFVYSAILGTLLLYLPGCVEEKEDEIFTTSPLSPTTVLNNARFEGLWHGIFGEYDYWQMRSNTDGSMQVIGINLDNQSKELTSLEGRMVLAEGDPHNYLSISFKEDLIWNKKYYFAPYAFCEDYLVFWIPSAKMFKEAIQTQVLSGKININKEVIITSPSAEVVKFLNNASGRQQYFFVDSHKYVFRKVMRNGQDKPYPLTETCSPEVSYAIADIYKYSTTPEGIAEATKWLRMAAEQGVAEAQYQLVLLYIYSEGQGVMRDDAEAVIWLRKAAEQGVAEAQNLLGHLYREGQGVMQDDAEAAKWLRKAAEVEQGSIFPEAQYLLGLLYSEGQGVMQDDAEAAKWLRKAAEQGVAEAQYHLGELYLHGKGVPADSDLAFAWFTIASSNGSKAASEALYDLWSNMSKSDYERGWAHIKKLKDIRFH